MNLVGTLQVLVRVVETGSFSAVARERDLTQAAVARQISQLEEHFGVRLFHRTTRKLSLTDDGQVLLGLTRPVLDGVEGLEAALGRQSASAVGLVRVAVPTTTSRFLVQRFADFACRSPGLEGRARHQRSIRRHDRGSARPCPARRRNYRFVTDQASKLDGGAHCGGCPELYRAAWCAHRSGRSRASHLHLAQCWIGFRRMDVCHARGTQTGPCEWRISCKRLSRGTAGCRNRLRHRSSPSA